MNKNPKKTTQYGLFLEFVADSSNFDDSELFEKNIQIETKLTSIKIYFIQNQRLLGLESSFVNFITGERKQGGYHGGDKTSKDIEIKELIMKDNEYVKNFELTMDDKFDLICYIKITTSKDKVIEFGENKGKKITILNFQGDNMIQSFFGNYDANGINSIGFQYINRKQFIFYQILPILKLKHKINKDEEFKDKYDKGYKDLLKDNISMIYLYRACCLPESIFSKIIKYC
jgi:hypothetical protein